MLKRILKFFKSKGLRIKSSDTIVGILCFIEDGVSCQEVNRLKANI